jgi:hypothetical protein
MPPAGFEPAIPARVRPQTDALDSAATAIGLIRVRTVMCVLTLAVQDWQLTSFDTDRINYCNQHRVTWNVGISTAVTLYIISLQGHCSTITLSLWAFSYTAAIYGKTAEGFDKCSHLLYRLTTATAVYYYYCCCYYSYYYHHHHPTDHYKMTVDMSRDYNKSHNTLNMKDIICTLTQHNM